MHHHGDFPQLQVTNALLSALDEAVTPGKGPETRFKSYTWITEAHAALAADMGLSAEDYAPVQALLDELKRLLDGIALTGEVSSRLRARVAAFGELLSSQLGVAYMRRTGLAANRVDSRTLLTSDVDDAKNLSEADIYLEADVKPSIQVDRCNAAAQGAQVVICQGFIASTPTGATCLLGRGGSDTSAALFAALCGAQRLEIWTDVNGMFTADPRFVSNARLIRSITYREAQELAAMGAKVLHPRCLLPAAFAGIPVEVRNTMDPGDDAEITVVSTDGLEYKKKARAAEAASGGAGATAKPHISTPAFHAMPPARAPSPLSSSKIVYSSQGDGVVSESLASPTGGSDGARERSRTPSPSASSASASTPPPGFFGGPGTAAPKVLAVARRKGVTLVNMSSFDMWGNSGFLAKCFTPFATHGVSVDLIATSQYAVSVTLDHIPDGVYGDTFRRVVTALSKTCTTTVRYPCAVVSVVGRSLRNALPALGSAMKALDGVPVHMVSEASEDLNLSFVVDEEHADKLVADLHGSLLEGSSMAADTQFGPVWTEMPCGRAPIPGEAKH